MNFVSSIITWQRVHGRHDLPWQKTKDPYRIWLSEIMLQQTQVATVIAYYVQFVDRFPNVIALAKAHQDEVMTYWAGLGYYARVRHLHRCAQIVVNHFNGQFPTTAVELAKLPGIGPSTAAAIAAFAYGEQSPILDGNVKRVLARYFGVEGDPTRRATEQALWKLAHAQLTHQTEVDMSAYTQGLMDLGATLCTRRHPQCTRCPLQISCIANQQSRQHELPTAKVHKAVPERHIGMLVVQYQDKVLLEQRPLTGIWGGLWSLPEFNLDAHSNNPESACSRLGISPLAIQTLLPFIHPFTHYRLHVQAWHVQAQSAKLHESCIVQRWINQQTLSNIALPSPIKKLLNAFFIKSLF